MYEDIGRADIINISKDLHPDVTPVELRNQTDMDSIPQMAANKL